MTKKTVSAIALLVAFAILQVLGSSMTAEPQNLPANMGRIMRLDPRLDRLLLAGAALEKIADGFAWVEGPVWNRKEGYLLFSDIPSNSVFKWKEGAGTSLFLKPSGYTGSAPFQGREPGSNGLAFDPAGRLVLCEHGDRRITRLSKERMRDVADAIKFALDLP